jgi:ADP-heptose:LPS heptosyltransferase
VNPELLHSALSDPAVKSSGPAAQAEGPTAGRIFACHRRIARGDVLLTTPILRALKRQHPGCRIFYKTDFPEILARNPNVAGVNVLPEEETGIEKCDFEYGDRPNPNEHIIDRFSRIAGFRAREVTRQLELFPDHTHFDFAHACMPGRGVVIAAGPGLWTGRNWSESRWQKVCRYLMERGCHPVLVGSERDYRLACKVDLRGRTSYHEMAACISRADLFIGIDSFPLHVAGAMNVPRIALFGVTLARLILCDAPGTTALQSALNHPLTGLRNHVVSMQQIEMDAVRSNPMDTLPVEAVIEAARRQLNLN